MDNRTLAKVFLVAGFLCILAAFAWSGWIVFGGPRTALSFLFSSLLLGAGVVLVVLAKKTYR